MAYEERIHTCTRSCSLGQLAEHLGAQLIGDENWQVSSVSSLDSADCSCVSFYYRLGKPLSSKLKTQAGALILDQSAVGSFDGYKLIVDDARAAFAQAVEFLFPKVYEITPRIHPSAIIDPDAYVDLSATVGPFCRVGSHSHLGAEVHLGSHVVVGSNCRIGSDSLIHDRSLIYNDSQIGKGCVIHQGAVIGAQGFGFYKKEGTLHPITHLGRTILGDYVDIGSLVTIDRGTLDATIIEDHCKLDNQCHVAHNCHLGAHSVVLGGARIGGSCTIGKRCLISANTVLRDHISIADDTCIDALSCMLRSNKHKGCYSSTFPAMDRHTLWRFIGRLRRLVRL